MIGTTAPEIARFYPDQGTFGESGFLVTVDDVTTITAYGGGGVDEAYLYDSPGDDSYVASPGHGELSGDGFKLETYDFAHNFGYATADNGGLDTARLEDRPKSDKFKVDWTEDDEVSAKMYGGGVYFNQAEAFDQIVAVMTGGTDKACLFDSAGNDILNAQRDESSMTGADFKVTVTGYDKLTAYGSHGTDQATLQDSDEDDTVRARPHKAQLWSGHYRDPNYIITARGFADYHFESTNGGFDKAKLHDTVFDDHADASTQSIEFYQNDSEMDLLYEAVAFEWVKLYTTSDRGQNTIRQDKSLDYDLNYDITLWDDLP